MTSAITEYPRLIVNAFVCIMPSQSPGEQDAGRSFATRSRDFPPEGACDKKHESPSLPSVGHHIGHVARYGLNSELFERRASLVCGDERHPGRRTNKRDW